MQDAIQNTTLCDRTLCDRTLCDRTLCDRTLCDQTLCDQTSQENPRIDERSQVATNSPRLSNADTHDSKIHELRKQIRTLETISRNSDDEAVISSGSSALDAILPAKGFARGTLIEWIAHSNQSSRPNHSPQQRLHQNEMDGSGVMMLAFAAAKEACRDGGMFVIMDQHRTFFSTSGTRTRLSFKTIGCHSAEIEKRFGLVTTPSVKLPGRRNCLGCFR